MLKIHTIILLIAVFINFAYAKKTVLKIGYYNLPPHSYSDKGFPSGSAVEYLSKKIFTQKDYQIEWKHFPFARMMAELEAGKLDVGLLIAKNKTRARQFQYPKTYLYETKSGLITLKKSEIKEVKDLVQLSGKIIGHVSKSVRPKELVEAGAKFQDISGTDNLRRNLQKLKYKRIDAVYIPTLSHGVHFIKNNFQDDNFQVVQLPLKGYKLYTVFSKSISKKIVEHFDKKNKIHNQKYQSSLK
ncbi:MAG: transporter substrate-binding domain-containing protein [Oligoflexia bacterium]|nr:transporter substrate-binding domain-containing protein [Oligoflexia bacterium]